MVEPSDRNHDAYPGDVGGAGGPTTLADARSRPRRPVTTAEERAATTARRQRRKLEFLRELGGSAHCGVGIMGMFHVGDPRPPSRLAWDIIALCQKETTAADRRRLLDILANHPRLVSSVALVRGRDARRVVRRFLMEKDERWQELRKDMLPRLRRWAVRCAWRDAEAGPQEIQLGSTWVKDRQDERGKKLKVDPRTLAHHQFAQWFRQRAMHHYARMLVALAERPRHVMRVLARSMRPPDRDAVLVRLLVPDTGHEQHAAMLDTTRGALRVRLMRLTRNAGGKSRPPGKPRT